MTRGISPSAVITRGLLSLTGATLAIILAATGSLVGAQVRGLSRVRTIAVAPFADDDPTTRLLANRGAARLSDLLRGGRFQIIDSSRVAVEMGRAGLTAQSLVSPSQTILLGTRLGADAMLTGRIVQIFQDSAADPPGEGGSLSAEGHAAIDIRVLDVSSRLILLQEEFPCTVPGLMAEAVECVVREVAARLRQSQN